MTCAIAACAVALRSGLELRRGRRFRKRRAHGLRERHLAVAKPAVAMVLVGLVGGPVSSVWLRNWEPLRTFHGWIGITAAGLFVVAAVLGRRLERGESRAFDKHALVALLAMLTAGVAFVAGFVLLP